MAKKRKDDDQLLRRAFDKTYEGIDRAQKIEIDPEELKEQLREKALRNRRVIGASLIAIAIAIIAMVAVFALDAYMDYLAWENRPTFEELLAAPYDLGDKLPPYLLNFVEVDAQVNGLAQYEVPNITVNRDENAPDATEMNRSIVKIQSIVPKQIGDFTLQWDRVMETALAQCLEATGTVDAGRCQTEFDAEFLEMANFVNSEGDKLSLVLTKFADEEQAQAIMDSVYRYARRLGLIGNFALTDMIAVDYFYSATRGAVSFTWYRDNWVMSVSADRFTNIDNFMEDFPLYENNEALDQIVVEQVFPPTPEPVAEVTPEVTPEVTAEPESGG